jgi:S-adenosylmethionine/arginine decarboxylase-like enzyme
MREHPGEAQAVIVCGLFQVQFRDAEVILSEDHVTIHEWYSSGIAHLTDYLNGHE